MALRNVYRCDYMYVGILYIYVSRGRSHKSFHQRVNNKILASIQVRPNVMALMAFKATTNRLYTAQEKDKQNARGKEYYYKAKNYK